MAIGVGQRALPTEGEVKEEGRWKQGSEYNKLANITAPPYAPFDDYVPPTSYDTLVFDGLLSMARLFVAHNLHGLSPSELVEAAPAQFKQVKHLDITISLHRDQDPCLWTVRKLFKDWRRGFANGSVGPLFIDLETFHLSIIYHHPDKTHNVPIERCLHAMVEGLFTMVSAKHVRLIQIMVQAPTPLANPCDLCVNHQMPTCPCIKANFFHHYPEVWFPIQDKIEAILSSYPLETFDLPFFTKTLPLAKMRMTMDCGYELEGLREATPHPVPALFNRTVTIRSTLPNKVKTAQKTIAVDNNHGTTSTVPAQLNEPIVDPVSPDQSVGLDKDNSEACRPAPASHIPIITRNTAQPYKPLTPSPLSPNYTAHHPASYTKPNRQDPCLSTTHLAHADARAHGRSMLAYVEESGSWKRPAAQTINGRRFDDWSKEKEKHTGPAWMVSGVRKVQDAKRKEFVIQSIHEALPLKGSAARPTYEPEPIDRIKAKWSIKLQIRLKTALEAQMVKSRPFKLDSGAAWREWIASGQDVETTTVNPLSKQGGLGSRYSWARS